MGGTQGSRINLHAAVWLCIIFTFHSALAFTLTSTTSLSALPSLTYRSSSSIRPSLRNGNPLYAAHYTCGKVSPASPTLSTSESSPVEPPTKLNEVPLGTRPNGDSSTNPTSTATESKNVNFLRWISDQPLEVPVPKSLKVQGTIPSYVQGTLIRNGGAQWSAGSGQDRQRYGHIFDGLAKLTRYEIHGCNGDDTDDSNSNRGTVSFSTKFIESKWRDAAKGPNGTLLEGLTIGPRMNDSMDRILDFSLLQSLVNSISFDNTSVNVWDFLLPSSSRDIDNNDTKTKKSRSRVKNVYALTDAPVRAEMNPQTLATETRPCLPPLARNAKGYELTWTAHPEYCKKGSGMTFNLMVEVNPFIGNQVSIVKEYVKEGESTNANEMVREVVGSCKVPDGGVPYCHSFGLTESKAVILLQPIRMNLGDLSNLIKEGFLETMHHDVTKTPTRVIVIDTENGNVLANVELDEQVYFYHSISSCESTDASTGRTNVSFKVCGYDVPDLVIGEDRFMRLDRAQTTEGRNRIHPGGKICEVSIELMEDGSAEPSASVKWTDPYIDYIPDNGNGFSNESVEMKMKQGFELPTTRYSRWRKDTGDVGIFSPPWKKGQHPTYAYAFSTYALGSDEYDAWSIVKINLETGQTIPFRERPSCYYSEPIFVADPGGKDEDDGILLCTRYDGHTDTSSLLLINAKTMKIQAEADTGMRIPMDFHGTFFADSE